VSRPDPWGPSRYGAVARRKAPSIPKGYGTIRDLAAVLGLGPQTTYLRLRASGLPYTSQIVPRYRGPGPAGYRLLLIPEATLAALAYRETAPLLARAVSSTKGRRVLARSPWGRLLSRRGGSSAPMPRPRSRSCTT
jgi:hypothetical protein